MKHIQQKNSTSNWYLTASTCQLRLLLSWELHRLKYHQISNIMNFVTMDTIQSMVSRLHWDKNEQNLKTRHKSLIEHSRWYTCLYCEVYRRLLAPYRLPIVTMLSNRLINGWAISSCLPNSLYWSCKSATYSRVGSGSDEDTFGCLQTVSHTTFSITLLLENSPSVTGFQ